MTVRRPSKILEIAHWSLLITSGKITTHFYLCVAYLYTVWKCPTFPPFFDIHLRYKLYSIKTWKNSRPIIHEPLPEPKVLQITVKSTRGHKYRVVMLNSSDHDVIFIFISLPFFPPEKFIFACLFLAKKEDLWLKPLIFFIRIKSLRS